MMRRRNLGYLQGDCEKYEERGDRVIQNVERFAFYEEARKAYAIVATGESAVYANVMLQKGVI